MYLFMEGTLTKDIFHLLSDVDGDDELAVPVIPVDDEDGMGAAPVPKKGAVVDPDDLDPLDDPDAVSDADDAEELE